MRGVEDAVAAYIAGISDRNRPLFDRLHRLVLDEFPDVELTISYQMPTFVVDDRRLYVGSWKHGLSVYGWDQDRNTAFLERHPDLSNGRGTIKLPPDRAEAMPDDELRELVRGALEP